MQEKKPEKLITFYNCTLKAEHVVFFPQSLCVEQIRKPSLTMFCLWIDAVVTAAHLNRLAQRGKVAFLELSCPPVLSSCVAGHSEHHFFFLII